MPQSSEELKMLTAKLDKDYADLQNRVSEFIAKQSSLKSVAETLQSKLSELQKKNGELQNKIQQQENEIRQMKEQLTDREKEIERLKYNLSVAQKTQ